MLYGIALIVTLIVAGGAIAVIGDRLGSKIGKKRLSLFGLRPRHTSTLVTIVTGAMIVTLTFAILAAVSVNVRTALFGMEKLNQSMKETQEKLQAAQEALAQSTQERQEADKALAASKAEVEKSQQEAKTLKLGNEQLRGEKDTLQQKNAGLQEENHSLLTKNNDLGAANQALGEKNASLGAENQSLNTENQSLGAANETLGKENATLSAENQTLETRTNELRQGIETLREGDIIFRAGEVIAAGVIEGHRPVDEVKADLEAIALRASRSVAERLGSPNAGDRLLIYSPEYDMAVAEIAKSSGSMVVRIVAAGNLLRGEPVRTSLQLYKNNVIYQKGDFIVAQSYKMQGGSQEAAEETLMDFLQRVNAAASAKGILPDPIRGSVGTMEAQQFYDIVQAIEPIRGMILLSAYARERTDALGPLQINVRLEAERPAP